MGVTLSASCGLWRGGVLKPGDQPLFAFAYESRVFFYAFFSWVDKLVLT